MHVTSKLHDLGSAEAEFDICSEGFEKKIRYHGEVPGSARFMPEWRGDSDVKLSERTAGLGRESSTVDVLSIHSVLHD